MSSAPRSPYELEEGGAQEDEGPQLPTPWALYKLQQAATLALRLLSDLTDTAIVGPDSIRLPAMPKSALLHTQGLACIYRRKAGLLLSRTKAQGFIIKRIVRPDGTSTWSAPVFVRGRGFGLGLTAGVSRTFFCGALMNTAAFERELRQQCSASVACSFLVDMNGSYLRKTVFDSSTAGPSEVVTHDGGAMTATYFRGTAMLVDGSVNVHWMYPFSQLNAELYGEGVDALSVLNGDLPPPEGFRAVHELLDRLTAQAAAVMPGKKDRSGYGLGHSPSRPLERRSRTSSGGDGAAPLGLFGSKKDLPALAAAAEVATAAAAAPPTTQR